MLFPIRPLATRGYSATTRLLLLTCDPVSGSQISGVFFKDASLCSVSGMFIPVKFRAHSVGRWSVSLLVTSVHCEKTADSIEMLFGVMIGISPNESCIRSACALALSGKYH